MSPLKSQKIDYPLIQFDRGIRKFPDTKWEDLFARPHRGNLSERLSIYATGYSVRSRDSMEEVFEVLPHILGESRWLNLGYHYTKAYPSRSYNLADVGLKLPNFLKKNKFSQSVIKLAEFEILVWKAFHSQEEKFELKVENLERLNEKSVFLFHPSFKILSSEFKIAEVWQDRSKAIARGREYSVIYRNHFQVGVDIISREEWMLLRDLHRGVKLAVALNRLKSEVKPKILSAWLHRWFDHRYFFKFS